MSEKLGWPYDAADALPQLEPHQRAPLQRGIGMVEETIPHLRDMGRDAATIAHGVGGALAKPSAALGRGLTHVGTGVQSFLKGHPNASGYLAGGAVLAPILGNAFMSSQQKVEDQLMDANRDPGRVITSSLDEFLEKKATLRAHTGFSKTAAWPAAKAMKAVGGKAVDSIAGGVGGGIGKGVADALFGGLGSGFKALQSLLSSDPKRKKILESVLRSDPVVSDAIKRNPKAQEGLLEAYGTLVRFAPNLSMDVNAVRSFLREAVLSGGGVNYATIKNLAETEKAVNERGGRGSHG